MSSEHIGTSQIPQTLFEAVKAELNLHPQGLKEYDLISALKAHGFFTSADTSAEPMSQLFQTHFILFYVLYCLRDEYLDSKQYILEIEALNIRLLPYKEGTQALHAHDKLRAYYLDIANLDNTSEDDVCELIASFWNRMGKSEKRDEALAVLGLCEPVNNESIKQAYRKLVMQHHPDRGGDKQILQAINQAASVLLD